MVYLKNVLNETESSELMVLIDLKKNVHTETCIQMFTAALFIKAKNAHQLINLKNVITQP